MNDILFDLLIWKSKYLPKSIPSALIRDIVRQCLLAPEVEKINELKLK